MISNENFSLLKEVNDYREFLSVYLKITNRTLSDFARAAGFVRGFPGDIISRRRRLSAGSYKSFASALILPSAAKRYFRLLVARDERDLFPEISSSQIEKGLRSLRLKTWQSGHRVVQADLEKNLTAVMRELSCLSVYAAAGSPGSRTPLHLLISRTALSVATVKKAIQLLKKARLLEQIDSNYSPIDFHTALRSTPKPSASFKILFKSALTAAALQVDRSADPDQELFFTSSFCVNEKELGKLKTELRALLLRYVDEAIEPEGGRVVHLVTGLHL